MLWVRLYMNAPGEFPYSLLVAVEIHVMTDQFLTLIEVTLYLKLIEKTAYKLAAEGKLPGFKVGGSWRFKSEDVESWINKKKSEAVKK